MPPLVPWNLVFNFPVLHSTSILILSRSALLSWAKIKRKRFQNKKKNLHDLEGDNEKPYTVWSDFSNLMLRINIKDLKLGHRGKYGKPEAFKKEQEI